MEKIILASTSPRRQQLLQLLQRPFTILTGNVKESFTSETLPHEVVQQLALRKAKAVAERESNAIIIGADTVVVFRDEILGKPANRDKAIAMLRKLSGETHTVFTGLALVKNDQIKTFYEETEVSFWKLTDEEINNYVATGEPFDKAGGYGIQQLGATLVKKINGDYYNVVGLPVGRLKRELESFLRKV